MNEPETTERCPALFDPYERNNRPAPERPNAITVQCERPAGHERDKRLGWGRFVHRSGRREWNVRRGYNFRYWACGEVAKENGGGRCVKFTAHTGGGARNQHHETADGLRWGGLVFVGPDPLSRTADGDEPGRCSRVFAGQRCVKPSPHGGKQAGQHVTASGDVWVIEYGRGVRLLRARRARV